MDFARFFQECAFLDLHSCLHSCTCLNPKDMHSKSARMQECMYIAGKEPPESEFAFQERKSARAHLHS